jgi:hypothetical protein
MLSILFSNIPIFFLFELIEKAHSIPVRPDADVGFGKILINEKDVFFGYSAKMVEDDIYCIIKGTPHGINPECHTFYTFSFPCK